MDQHRKPVLPMGDPKLHDQLAAEVETLARIYALDTDAESLEATAAALEAVAGEFAEGRERVRFWAVLLRARAERVRAAAAA